MNGRPFSKRYQVESQESSPRRDENKPVATFKQLCDMVSVLEHSDHLGTTECNLMPARIYRSTGNDR